MCLLVLLAMGLELINACPVFRLKSCTEGSVSRPVLLELTKKLENASVATEVVRPAPILLPVSPAYQATSSPICPVGGSAQSPPSLLCSMSPTSRPSPTIQHHSPPSPTKHPSQALPAYLAVKVVPAA